MFRIRPFTFRSSAAPTHDSARSCGYPDTENGNGRASSMLLPLLPRPGNPGKPKPLPANATSTATVPATVPATASRMERLRGRFAQAVDQYSIDTPWSTTSRYGTVLEPDPRAPLVPTAVLPPRSSRSLKAHFASAAKRDRQIDDARTQAAGVLLDAACPTARLQSSTHRRDVPPASVGWVERMAILFPGQERAALDELQWALYRFKAPQGADRTVVGDVLAQASRGDAVLAREILERLAAGLDFHDLSRPHRFSDRLVEQGMWRAAQLLARSEEGFRLLQGAQPPGRELGRAARVILQVGDHGMLDARADPQPAAVIARIEHDPLQRAALAGSALRAAYRMLDPQAELTQHERGVIFAWEQGFREDGPGTPLEAVKQRLVKFTQKSIPRVESSRWRSTLPRMFGRRKSPLAALRMGVHGADRNNLAKEHGRAQAHLQQAGGVKIKGFKRRPRSLRLSRPDREDARQVLDRLIMRLQSGSRIRLADGGRRGLSLQGLTIGLSNFLHTAGIPLGLRLNLSRTRTKRAVLEIGRNTFCGEITFGHDARRQNTIGAGIIAGYDINAGLARLRCGAGVDISRSMEQRHISGVILRVARRRLPDGKGFDDERLQAGMREITHFLFDESHSKQDLQPDAVFDRFATRFFDAADVSIGLNNHDIATLEHTASASVSLAVNLAASRMRIGPTAALTATRTALRQRGHNDAGGRLQASVLRTGVQTDVALTAGLTGKIGFKPSDVGILSSNFAQLTIPFHRHGQHVKARLVREGGRLSPQGCTLDLEFTRIDDYANAIRDEIDAGAVQTLLGTGNARTCANWASSAVAAHLANTRHFARDNQVYWIRKRLCVSVARAIDRSAAAAETVRGCEHLPLAQRDQLCAQLDAEATALLARPDSWEMPELKVLERSGRLRRSGLQWGLQLASESQAEGERSLASLAVG